MKYAIFSDVHGNLEAFKAVLEAMSGEKPGKYLCVGDIVGYGADPAECIKMTQGLNPETVAGNHDWAVGELVDAGYFNSSAKAAVLWARENLTKKDLGYLKSLKLTYQNSHISMVHGTLDCPEAFSYVLNGYTAARTMALMPTPLCFIGHSHVAGTFCDAKGIVNYTPGGKVKVDPGNKYLVNVGSVGQPRDGDPRASYCIYDTKKAYVEIKRVSYDIKTAQRKILKQGLPEILASRLSEGR